MLKMHAKAILAFMFCIVLAFGCQRRSNQESRYSRYEKEDSDNAHAEKLLREMEIYISRNPRDVKGAQSRLYEIEGIAQDGIIAESAKDLAEKVRLNSEADALNNYKHVLDKAKDMADEGRFDMALRELDKFIDKFSSADCALQAREERQKISKISEAKSAYERFVLNIDNYRAVKEYDNALKYIVVKKPKGLSGTPYKQKLADYITKLYAEADKDKEQRLREGALPWEKLATEEYGSWKTHGGLWKVENGVIHGINRDDNYGRFMVGEDNWKDYVVEMRFKLVSGEFDLGLRGIPLSLGSRSYKTLDVCYGIDKSDKEIEVKIIIRGEMVSIQSPALEDARHIKITEQNGELKYWCGPICIFLRRGAEVEFSRLRVKHLGKVAQPTAER